MEMRKTTLLLTPFVYVLLTLGCVAMPLMTDINGKVISKVTTGSVIALWPEGTDGINPAIAEQTRSVKDMFYNIHNPSLSIFQPKNPNGTSVYSAHII
jgi:hypothetical protein